MREIAGIARNRRNRAESGIARNAKSAKDRRNWKRLLPQRSQRRIGTSGHREIGNRPPIAYCLERTP